jgi:hypothetical protein
MKLLIITTYGIRIRPIKQNSRRSRSRDKQAREEEGEREEGG